MFLVWLRVAAVLYAVASLTALPAVLYAYTRWRSVYLPAAGLAFLFHLVSVTEMLGIAHRLYPVGYAELESLLGLVIAGIFLAISGIYRTDSFGVFALPASFFLVFVPAIGAQRYVFPSSGVRTGWLVVHIVFLLAAYASLAFSMVASFLYLVQERKLKSHLVLAGHSIPTSQNRDAGYPKSLSKIRKMEYPYSNPTSQNRDMGHPIFSDFLPPLDTLERIAHATLLFGFPCMTLGLLVGSLLAQESVGPAYFSDPKVLLSFAMWALYVVLLYIRRSAGLRGRRAAYLSTGVFVVILLVWVANQFSQVHRFPGP
ncbi:inner membrane protein YpjD [Acidicapsa dinghuensis]|uniref:Inner membrane protein YpjD n=1 Tax=Acidicapsa dinghuensis TaxID=2218256 RepID=A0ABW1EPL8_9BACT|nr:cytochrome c biogenesis protein [Acidicapsa dinghuensis]